MYADAERLAGSWLLTYMLHSTILLGCAWLVTRRSVESAARRDLIWKAALIGGLATATAQRLLPFQPLAGVLSVAREVVPVTVSPAEPAADSWEGIRPPAGASGARPSEPAAPPPGAYLAGPPTPVDAGRSLPRGLTLALVGWLVIGGGLFGIYLVQRRRAMHGIGPRQPVTDAALLAMLGELRRAGGIGRSIRLTQAPGLASPIALGWDEIVLPEAALTDLDPAQQKCLLAHELAHLVRRDPLWLTLGCSIERLFFFQPLNRLARIRLQEAAEYLCDDWAVRRTGSGVSLATCLVKVAEWVTTPPQPVPLAGIAERRSQLVTRIHRLLEGRSMTTAPRTLWLAAGSIALLGITVAVAPSVSAHAQQPLAQDTVAQDTTESAYRRMLRRMRLLESRAQRDARAALIEARLAPTPGAPVAPMPSPAPRPTPAPDPMPALAPILAEARLAARLDMERALTMASRDRTRDTTGIAVPALVSALRDSDVEVRRAAAQSLAQLEDPRAVPGLIAALEDKDTEVRAYAAMALGRLEDRRALAPLLTMMKDPSVEIRRHALGALGHFAEDVPLDAILSAMNDADIEVRHQAMSLAMQRASHDDDGAPEPRLVAAFGRMLKDASAEVRQMALSGLGSLGLTQASPELLALEKDRSGDVRQQLAYTLGSIGDPKAVPVLKNLLADPSADVREAAIQGLSEVRDQAALEALVSALKSTDPVVRRHAAQALGHRGEE